MRKICDDLEICWEDLGIELGFKWLVVCNVDIEKKKCCEKVKEIICFWKKNEGKVVIV